MDRVEIAGEVDDPAAGLAAVNTLRTLADRMEWDAVDLAIERCR